MSFDLAGGRRLMLAGGSMGWTWAVVALVALGLLVWLYREERRLISTRTGLALLGLRGLAMLVLVAALFEPIASRTWRETARGRVLVAVDDSESMTTVDPGRPAAELKAMAASPGDRLEGVSRRDIARRLVEGPLARLGEDHDVRATLFARDALPATSLPDAAASLRKAPRSGDPGRSTTDWTDALALGLGLERPDDAPLVGVVLVTDGRSNGPGDASAVVDRLAARGVPVYPVLVGSTKPPPDAAVASVKAPDSVNRGDVAHVNAVLKLDGFPPGSSVEVTLTRPGGDPLTQRVAVPDDGSRPTATFRVPLEVAGPTSLTVAVEPAPDDARSDNDRRTVVVRVADDKARVLLVDGEARWEFQYLRNALARDPRVSVDAIVFRQPTTAASVDPGYPATWPIRPNRPEPDPLGKYDLIVVGDVDPADLSADAWARLDSFVAERGGSLALLPGPRFWPALAGGEASRPLLPVTAPHPLEVTPEDVDPSHPALPPGLAVAPRAEALEAPDLWPMLQIGEGPQGSRDAWSVLPRLPWAIAGKAKPSATTLAVAGGREEAGALIASHAYGLGKVLWVGTNATWRWRYRVGDEIHHRFWGQVVRWANSGALAVGNRIVRHGPGKSRVGRGEAIRLQARIAEDAVGVPLNPLIAARIFPRGSRGEAVAVVPLRPAAGQPRVFEGVGPGLPEGDYVIRLDAPQLVALSEAQGAGPIPDAPLEVAPGDTPERVELAATRDPLVRLAAATAGRVFADFEAAALPAALKARSRPVERTEEFPLWDHPATLALFFAILTVEWVVRKRAGLP